MDHFGDSNGYRPGNLTSQVGDLELLIPSDRRFFARRKPLTNCALPHFFLGFQSGSIDLLKWGR
jgi:hypothetical protein